MLRCMDCGWTGEFEELKRVEESRGEFWGVPCSETMYYCPACGSDYIEDEADLYERFTNVFYPGTYVSSFDDKTELVGRCYCVGERDDDEGYHWRSFTPEQWEQIKGLTNAYIFDKYPEARCIAEEVPNVLE